MRIAITGGIGSGKSTVADTIREMGYTVASCDDTYKALCAQRPFLEELGKLFPDAVKGDPPALDRAELARLAFGDAKRLSQLNAFTHPRIMEAMFAETAGADVAFYEVPLLFESGLKDDFDKTLVVLRDRGKRKESAMMRSGLTDEQAEARIRSQFDYDTADLSGCIVIENDGDKTALGEKTRRAVAELLGDSAV